MSDLQCPATLLVSRHGDAGYAVEGVMSDDGGALTDKGRDQVRHLVERVRSRRVAAVYSSQMGRAVESAELAASELGLRALAVDGLQEFSVGDLAGVGIHDDRAQQVFGAWLHGDLAAAFPGAEDGQAVVKRFKGALEEIADRHRGETVLVFTHGGAMSLAIPRLSFNLRNDLAAQRFLPNCVPAEVEIDADGWRVVTWPGATDQLTDQGAT
ncbi:MAG: histidine phosphatase family protein [Phycicoccus sp.]|nr:histidine phosphatase family protein [Phycicoccus sp.]NMM33691.1 histidine phosphatase family protein [Phycicoccus sp.]